MNGSGIPVIGIPLATRLLIREVRGNRWWVFAVFPGLFGFAFDWGFYNFLVGIPVALLLVLLALRFDNQLSARRIAEILDFPSPFHVYRRLNSLLAQVRQKLESRGFTDPDP